MGGALVKHSGLLVRVVPVYPHVDSPGVHSLTTRWSGVGGISTDGITLIPASDHAGSPLQKRARNSVSLGCKLWGSEHSERLEVFGNKPSNSQPPVIYPVCPLLRQVDSAVGTVLYRWQLLRLATALAEHCLVQLWDISSGREIRIVGDNACSTHGETRNHTGTWGPLTRGYSKGAAHRVELLGHG